MPCIATTDHKNQPFSVLELSPNIYNCTNQQSRPLSWIEKRAYWDIQRILHAIKINLLVTAIRQNCRDYDNRGVN